MTERLTKTRVWRGELGLRKLRIEGVERGQSKEEHQEAHAERNDEWLCGEMYRLPWEQVYSRPARTAGG